jgi:ferredoxin-NADP reductase
VYSSPELTLLVGNIFSYAVSPKGRRVLTLKEKTAVSTDIYHFAFTPDKPFSFRPGQYLEWTLEHDGVDGRGNRRYFTIASSPTEDTTQLGIKFYEPSSSFKTKLLAMQPGETIVAGGLAGEFTLPNDPAQKLVFIAGGIGITPFRSMVKDLVDRQEKRDIVLLYSNRNAAEIAYRDVFDDAAHVLGMRTIYTITDPNEKFSGVVSYKSRITADIIKKEVPDYQERMFYISGTHEMTSAFKETLREMGVPDARVRTDFFPGFA